ncbi:MAG: amidohydrolase family protein [Oscillospiraceae bacterium]|nr:amidohydrolase family protein [Oscillospiraceae bacterium]
MPIIDFHVHCFSQRIAERAVGQLARVSGARNPLYDGTPEALLATMERCGVDEAVILNIATNPKQQRAVNDFAIEINNTQPRLHGFGSVHPDAPDAIGELRRLKAAGIKGVKFHPDYQNFFVNESRVFPLYEEIARLGLITVFHSGVDIGLPDPVHCRPAALAEVLPRFGGAPVIAAHFGGYLLWEEAMLALCGTEIYLDTSYSAKRIPPPWGKRLLAAHDSGRILLGSDLPWADPRDELYFLRGLTEDEGVLAGIFGGNAQRLLK